MKKLIGILVALTTMTCAQAQGPVYSVNIVGYQRTATPPGTKLNFLSNPFLKDDNSINSVIGPQAEQFVDEIFLWDGTSYSKFIFVGDVGDPNINNKWIDPDTFLVASAEILPGAGFIYKNASTVTNNLTFVGDVVSVSSITNAIPAGITIISYPYSTSFGINATLPSGVTSGLSGIQGAAKFGDEIFAWDVGSQSYQKSLFVEDVSDPNLNFKWIDPDTFQPSTLMLTPGTSYFYKNVGTNPRNWVANKPY